MSEQWGIWDGCEIYDILTLASLEQWRRGLAPNVVFSPDPPKAPVFFAAS